MFWRLENLPGEGDGVSLLYDEVGHRLHGGDADGVRLPRHPALILSLLLRMHEQGSTLSAAQICAFLELPAGSRVSGHVSELRKKIGACGVDPGRVLELKEIGLGYRLVDGVRAVRLSPAEVRQWLAELFERAEKAAPADGARRALRSHLRELLVLCSVFALAFTGYLRFRPDDDEQLRQRTPEEGDFNTVVPQRPCLELGRDLALSDQDVLAVELSRTSHGAPAHVVISIERERSQDGVASMAFDLGPSAASTVRIAASSLEPGVRSHARRVCIGKPGDVDSGQEPSAIRLTEVRIE